MENTPDIYISLIAAYLSGEAGPKEIGMLAAWVEESPENAATFQGLHKAWLIENQSAPTNDDMHVEWNELQLRIKRNHKTTLRRSLFSMPYRIAAILVFFAIASGIVWFVTLQDKHTRLMATASNQVFTLPDGSRMTLQKGSYADYPAAFGRKERHIRIHGQALLEVAHDTTRPFTARAGNLEVRVTGTSFYLSSETNNFAPVVILTEGRIKAYPAGKPNQAKNLVPGESARLETENGEIIIEPRTDPNLTSWNTMKFAFNNTPLPEVVTILTQSYLQEITLAGEGLEKCTLTATFEKQELVNVLSVITSALNIRWELRQDGYVLYGESCQ